MTVSASIGLEHLHQDVEEDAVADDPRTDSTIVPTMQVLTLLLRLTQQLQTIRSQQAQVQIRMRTYSQYLHHQPHKTQSYRQMVIHPLVEAPTVHVLGLVATATDGLRRC